LRIVAADQVSPAALHAAFVAAFADYIAGAFNVPVEQWPVVLARQAVDLSLSRVVVRADGAIDAFALVAPRPSARRWRLATMGAVPVARGSGAAPALLDDLRDRARAGGQAGLELEVFAQNGRAVRLYLGRGFVPRHELHGYALEAAVAGEALQPAPALEQVELGAAFEWLEDAMAELPDLPLQVTPAALRALAPPPLAWRRGNAQLVFGGAAGQALVIHSLVDRDRGQDDAFRLLQALVALHPGRPVRVPPLQRTDVGGAALARAGFERARLHQVWMLRTLCAPGTGPVALPAGQQAMPTGKAGSPP
jgi:ribosomal protein S18 acetylase RimI-like enzyme